MSPNRDKGSDGSVGDLAHQDRSSDHNPDESGETPYEDADSKNEVHAIDVDDDGPWPNQQWFKNKVLYIAARHRDGKDNRLQNIIYQGKIASRSWGWTWRTYTGSNGHWEHAHFSARYTTAQENDTSPWGVYVTEASMALTQAEITAIADAVWNKTLQNPDTLANTSAGGWLRWADRRKNDIIEEIEGLATTVSTLQATVASLRSDMDKLMSDPVDSPPENHIVECVRYANANP